MNTKAAWLIGVAIGLLFTLETRRRLTPLEKRLKLRVDRLMGEDANVRVSEKDGAVTIAGRVLADEVESLLRTIAEVRGVRSIQSRLKVRAE